MSRRVAVLVVAILAVAGLGAAFFLFDRYSANRQDAASGQEAGALVRLHSPVIGRADAPVTIVEFFDPACEACRSFYPIVKQIMALYPDDLRLVLRYTPFHDGSDEVVRIFETARMQGVFVPVMEAVLAAQPAWAMHEGPQLEVAWAAAANAGLDVEKARQVMLGPEVTMVLNQDIADSKAVGVTLTPTFFVNGKPLPSFGAQQLYDLVSSEVAAIR